MNEKFISAYVRALKVRTLQDVIADERMSVCNYPNLLSSLPFSGHIFLKVKEEVEDREIIGHLRPLGIYPVMMNDSVYTLSDEEAQRLIFGLQMDSKKLLIGDKINVVKGIFEGYSGVVQETGERMIKISIELGSTSVVVDIDSKDVGKVN